MKDKKLNGGQGDYREEMQELARIFKEELDKATEEAEKEETPIEELEVEGYNPRTVAIDEPTEQKPLSREELCECCGERARGTRKDPNSPFCSECEAILEKYPYDWKGAAAAILALFISVAALVCFIMSVPVFSHTIEGEKAYKDGKLYTALQKLDKAISHMDEDEADEYLNVYEKRIYTNYELLDMDSAVSDIAEYFSDFALKMPMYKGLSEIESDVIRMQASVLIVQNSIAEYNDITDHNYKEVQGILEGLLGKKIYVDGAQYNYEGEEGFTPTGDEDVYHIDEAWVYMYMYSVAQYVELGDKVITDYLSKAAEKSEYVAVLVNPLLAATYVGIGEYEKAEKLIPGIREANAEGIDAFLVEAMLYRYRDKDYTAGVDTCLKGLNVLSKIPDGSDLIAQVGYLLSMQKTLNYVMLKDYENAYKSAEECYAYQSETYSVSVQVRDMYAMLALQTGDTDTFKALEEEIKEYGEEAAGFSTDVADYKAGRVTLQELAMNGGYDLV